MQVPRVWEPGIRVLGLDRRSQLAISEILIRSPRKHQCLLFENFLLRIRESSLALDRHFRPFKPSQFLAMGLMKLDAELALFLKPYIPKELGQVFSKMLGIPRGSTESSPQQA